MNPTSLRIGYGERDITPTDLELLSSSIFLGGYGLHQDARRIATTVGKRIFVRTLSISDANQSIILCALDAPGLSHNVIKDILLATRLPNSIGHIAICATHSHSAPDFTGLWGGVSNQYLNRVIPQCAASITESLGNMAESKIHSFRVALNDFSENRRGWPNNDNNALVLVGRSILEPRTQFVLVIWGCHPTAISNSNLDISSDYVGYLLDSIAENYPGANVIFFNGAQGDTIPAGAREPGVACKDFAQRFGEAVGLRIAKTLNSGNGFEILGAIRINKTSLRHKCDNRLLAALAIQTGFPMVRNESGVAVDLEITRIGIGASLNLLMMPLEPTERMWQQLVNLHPKDFSSVISLANGFCGYAVPKDEWGSGRNRGYEESRSISDNLSCALLHHVGALRFD